MHQKIFGPQKWLSKQEISTCENIFKNTIKTINSHNHLKNGSGAAGGLGFFVYELLNGKIESGIKKIIEIFKVKEIQKDYDYVITGEGKFDSQSFFGKVPIEIAKISKNKTILIAGLIDIDEKYLKKYFIKSFQILRKNESPSSSIKNTPQRLKEIRKIIANLKDDHNDKN